MQQREHTNVPFLSTLWNRIPVTTCVDLSHWYGVLLFLIHGFFLHKFVANNKLCETLKILRERRSHLQRVNLFLDAPGGVVHNFKQYVCVDKNIISKTLYIPTDWLILQQYESKKWKEVQNPGHGIFPLRLGPLPYTQWSLATRRWAKRHWATETLDKLICCPFILLDNESVRG